MYFLAFVRAGGAQMRGGTLSTVDGDELDSVVLNDEEHD